MRLDEIDGYADGQQMVEEGEQAKEMLPVVQPVLLAEIETAAQDIENACAQGASMEQMLHLCHQQSAARRLGRILLNKIQDGALAKSDVAEMVQAAARKESAPAHVAGS